MRMWAKTPDGEIRPALSADPDDDDRIGHHPYACPANPAGCAPREGLGDTPAQNMVRELADSANARLGSGHRLPRKGKLTAGMARELAVIEQRRKAKRKTTKP